MAETNTDHLKTVVLAGKNGLIMGVVNKGFIGWALLQRWPNRVWIWPVSSGREVAEKRDATPDVAITNADTIAKPKAAWDTCVLGDIPCA